MDGMKTSNFSWGNHVFTRIQRIVFRPTEYLLQGDKVRVCLIITRVPLRLWLRKRPASVTGVGPHSKSLLALSVSTITLNISVTHCLEAGLGVPRLFWGEGNHAVVSGASNCLCSKPIILFHVSWPLDERFLSGWIFYSLKSADSTLADRTKFKSEHFSSVEFIF